jgi:hypothetical protein
VENECPLQGHKIFISRAERIVRNDGALQGPKEGIRGREKDGARQCPSGWIVRNCPTF